jgi:hypothetical protein
MSKSYIELTSGFRNRLLYPNAANFSVNPCELNADDHFENSNNISAAYPIYNFWSLPLNIIKRWDCTSKTQSLTITVDPPLDTREAQSLLESSWTTQDCCQPVIITDAYGAEGIIISVEIISETEISLTIQLGCEDTQLKADSTVNSATISGGNPNNPPIPYAGTIVKVSTVSDSATDTGNYKPELIPINYGLDTCNMHQDTQYINNPAVGLADSSSLKNNLSSCCVGTAAKPVFSNHIYPTHTVANMYNWKIEFDSCNEITSQYNTYASTGLIHKINGQCCIGKYFNGMTMSNFTPNCTDSHANSHRVSECSHIVLSSDAATLPVNRCCDILIPVRNWYEKTCNSTTGISYPPDGQKIDPCSAYSTYFSINASAQNPPITAHSVGCVTACPVTDSVSFDISPAFSGSFKTIDWFGKDTCWDQIKCEKAQYNPYVINNQSWNCLRIQGGGPIDANNAYCCSFVEMIPVPVDAKKNFSYALPGGLSDRFKTISSYDTSTKLASFNAYDCCNSLVQRQWQRMIYWQLYARCQRSDSPQAIYNPDMLCNTELLNRLATGTNDSAWSEASRVKGCPDSALEAPEQIITLASSQPNIISFDVCVPESDLRVGGTLTQNGKQFRIVEITKASFGFPPLSPSEGGPFGPPLRNVAIGGAPTYGTYDPRNGLRITVVPLKSECSYESDDFIQGAGSNSIDSIITVLVGSSPIRISQSTSIPTFPSNPALYSVSPNAEEAVVLPTKNMAIGAIRTYAVTGSISVIDGEILSAREVPATGGCGCGATFDIEGVDCSVSLSAQDISINNAGKNYKVGDKLQILPSAVTTVPSDQKSTLSTQSSVTCKPNSTIPSTTGGITNGGTSQLTIKGVNNCGDQVEAEFEVNWTGPTIVAGSQFQSTCSNFFTSVLVNSSQGWDNDAINGIQTWSVSGGAPPMFAGVWTSSDLQGVMTATLLLEINTVPPPIIQGPGIIITVKSVTPTTVWPDIGLSSEGTNYIWNYRMRQAMPDLIATSNTGIIKNTINYLDPKNPTVDSSGSTVDFATTTPPLFLMGVPYSLELISGGTGYRYGGYFIYGVDDCDLFEISYSVDCGKVINVKLTKLAIDSLIYEKLSGVTYENNSNNAVSYPVDKCDIGKQNHFFNPQIPDILELNKLEGKHYSYNWNGYDNDSRSRATWFGGSGACIRINKSYGFFSNLGHTENTNYAHKTLNTHTGPANDDSRGCLLFLPSVAEACNNNFGEMRNSLNFSTFYQTNKTYVGSFNTVDKSAPCPDSKSIDDSYNLKYQIDSQMKFIQQYPKFMDKEVGCQYNYAEPPFNSDSTGTTPIIANFSTQDIPIYWTKKLDPSDQLDSAQVWQQSRFNTIASNTQIIQNAGNLTQDSTLRVTKQPLGSNLNIISGTTSIIKVSTTNQMNDNVYAYFDLSSSQNYTADDILKSESITVKLTSQAGEWDDFALKNQKTFTTNNGTLEGDRWNSDNGVAISKMFRFFGVIDDSIVQQLVQGSVFITNHSFPGFPLNIDGIWNINGAQKETDGSFVGWDSYDPNNIRSKSIPEQCCAYEWEILPVTAPSVRPINNQLIPKASTQEQSCWRINLRNLLLPNIPLQSGSLASFYPYFYVEFSNETDVQRQSRMLQSNNPNSKPALFRCAVTDIATPAISKFLKLSGDGMYQTVKFRPNDSIKFKVYLPDGRDFMTTIPDTAPPSPVNPLLQISALFEIEHIE